MNNSNQYHDELKALMNEYVHFIYDMSLQFPREELYGLTSQLRRSALSVILNYIEGYARMRKRVLKNFLEISYGSLKESKYLLNFTFKRTYITEIEWSKSNAMADRIGRMLWGILKRL